MKLIRFIILTLALVLSLNAREKVNVSFSDLDINDFIKLISKITNKNILLNHKIIGTVNFVSNAPIYDDELIEILISVLESKGFTLVKNGSIYKIIRSAEAAKHNVRVIKQDKKLYGSLMVTQTIKVKGEKVDVLAAKVRYLISKTAKLMTIKETNTILITDYPKNIETIKKVINDIDKKHNFIIKIIPIENADAKKLLTKLSDISKSLFNEKIESQKIKFILDENINGIIAIGIEKNVKRIEELIQKLDVESGVNKGVQIFNLKNSDAKSVLNSLNEIISKQTFSDPALKPNLSMSEEINSIIAVGEPSIIEGFKVIIDELDKEKYQVYVQARIIEINKNNSKNLGIKYGLDGATLTSGGLYSFSGNFGGAPVSGVVGTAIGASVIGNHGLALGAAIDFLQTKGAAKSISNPSILCVNNKESSIYVGKTISIINGSTSNAVSGITNNFTREEIGLTLKIKPRVSSIDKVTLDIEAILENITDDGSNNASGQPVTSKQEVKTQAILRHGESIIIGGLIKSYDIKSKTKIPILGDLPFIGNIFSSNSVKNEEDNLIVILTPYIIDSSEKLSQLQKDLGMLADLQKEYNAKVFKKIEENKIQADKSKLSSYNDDLEDEY